MQGWPWDRLARAHREVVRWQVHHGVSTIEALPPTYAELARLVRDEMNRRGLRPHLFPTEGLTRIR